MMMLSRNKPVAYLVGVAGFLGSHLAEKLLAKNIQVVGVDNLSTGKRDYLENCSKDKNFHFLNQSADQEFNPDLPRIDYAFFIISENIEEAEYQRCLENFINLSKKFKAKIVYVSSLELYNQQSEKYPALKAAEKKLAQFSLDHKLNTRVIRLSAVYGPRMHFREDDPICRLIQAASCGRIQKENTTLDFTTRALYIDDAVDLLIKAVMHGATAQKMYDGALLYPLKVVEIKQLLLDPLWFESRGFMPTQLPPWPTPNIAKTQKELSWRSQALLMPSLKETLHFFEQNPQCLTQPEMGEIKSSSQTVQEDIAPLPEEKKQQLKEMFKGEPEKKGKEASKSKVWWKVNKNNLILALVLGLIAYGLLYPLTLVVITSTSVKSKLSQSYQASKVGDYQQAQKEASEAELLVGELKNNLSALKLFQTAGFLTPLAQSSSHLTEILEKTITGVQSQSSGQAAITQALKVISGEGEGDLAKLYQEAELNFSQAEESLGQVQGKLADPIFINSVSEPWPFFQKPLESNLKDLGQKIGEGENSLQKGKLFSRLLPGLIPVSGKKTYLILVRDSGGAAQSFARLNFEDGKLQPIVTEPLGWSLQEVNMKADFSAIARQLAWLYQKQSNQDVSGIMVMEQAGLVEISKIVNQGPTPVLKEILNNLFFSPNLDYNSLGIILDQMLEEKHLIIFVTDPLTHGYLSSQGWTGNLTK